MLTRARTSSTQAGDLVYLSRSLIHPSRGFNHPSKSHVYLSSDFVCLSRRFDCTVEDLVPFSRKLVHTIGRVVCPSMGFVALSA